MNGYYQHKTRKATIEFQENGTLRVIPQNQNSRFLDFSNLDNVLSGQIITEILDYSIHDCENSKTKRKCIENDVYLFLFTYYHINMENLTTKLP